VVWAIYCNIILPLKEDLLICPDIWNWRLLC
jgi:hypothetical protein